MTKVCNSVIKHLFGTGWQGLGRFGKVWLGLGGFGRVWKGLGGCESAKTV